MSMPAGLAKLPRRNLLLLLLLAILVLGLGLNKPTGLTGKDEYLLGVRVPLEMMERDVWWVPFVDGEPRLKKPPLVYWLTRASYQAFGPSLAAARGVTLAFALLLLGCTGWLGKRLSADWAVGLLGAAVLLSVSGMASESRRAMLDVPVAALSAAAFCCYLGWLDRPGWSRLLATATCLTAALMTKGPIALVVFGGGLIALWLAQPEQRKTIFGRLPAHLLLFAAAAILPLIWYGYARSHYPQELATASQDEMEARRLHISLDAVVGLITLALPWTFVALEAWRARRKQPAVRLLGIWLLMTLLPFFFIRSFDRYLIGSLIPLSLLAATALHEKSVPAWTRWLGSAPPALLALTLCLLLWRFELGGWPWLALALAYFLWAWWWPKFNAMHLLASSMALWAIGLGVAFPNLGVNAIPPRVVDLGRGHDVILFAGPEPALLPILAGKAMRQTSQISAADVIKPFTLIMVRAEDDATLQKQLQQVGIHTQFVEEFNTLASAGSGIRFAREGTNSADWHKAWDRRSLAPLMSTVRVFVVVPR